MNQRICELTKRMEYYMSNYECFTYVHNMGEIQPIVDLTDKVCRFCGMRYPDVRFRKKAHAISELIGNKEFVLKNESDECNEFFGHRLEDDFGKYLGLGRTLSQICRSAKKTVRELGYPVRSCLNNWIAAEGKPKQSRKKNSINKGLYTFEERLDVVHRCVDLGEDVHLVANLLRNVEVNSIEEINSNDELKFIKSQYGSGDILRLSFGAIFFCATSGCVKCKQMLVEIM